jgi:hypothetical protein
LQLGRKRLAALAVGAAVDAEASDAHISSIFLNIKEVRKMAHHWRGRVAAAANAPGEFLQSCHAVLRRMQHGLNLKQSESAAGGAERSSVQTRQSPHGHAADASRTGSAHVLFDLERR